MVLAGALEPAADNWSAAKGLPAKAPNATYARLHQQILDAKANFQQHLGWLQNQPLDPFSRNNLLDDEAGISGTDDT